MTDNPVFELNRVFDAPRELVWRAWTTPELLSRWYGPRVETLIHRFDLKPGGLWLNEMRMPNRSSFQKAEFIEVTAPDRLVLVQTTTDSEWREDPSQMSPGWPRKLHTEVTLSSVEKERTALRLRWTPYEATQQEIEGFASAISGMGKGWGAGMDLLEELLRELRP